MLAARCRLWARRPQAAAPAERKYYGIDLAVHDQGPNLIEADLLKSPIRFADKKFDIVLAQGFFEYMGTPEHRSSRR